MANNLVKSILFITGTFFCDAFWYKWKLYFKDEDYKCVMLAWPSLKKLLLKNGAINIPPQLLQQAAWIISQIICRYECAEETNHVLSWSNVDIHIYIFDFKNDRTIKILSV